MKLLRLPGCTKRLQILLVENVCTDRLAIFTARKRSLGQGNIFTPVCHSVHGGGGVPVPRGACSRGSACSRGVPALGVPGGDPPTPDSYCCGRYAPYWNASLFVLSSNVGTIFSDTMISIDLILAV